MGKKKPTTKLERAKAISGMNGKKVAVDKTFGMKNKKGRYSLYSVYLSTVLCLSVRVLVIVIVHYCRREGSIMQCVRGRRWTPFSSGRGEVKHPVECPAEERDGWSEHHSFYADVHAMLSVDIDDVLHDPKVPKHKRQ